ncbi:hypothetical protein [sulfur-oxidizing endosymbiont of Gigantopelta aegis]|uniref:hypothetical protein n=1 Tax=sulfur-oxidizing endosymbiont of Gigantopelta aegis TaxID=2794934 RepID=UPI0018DD810F|nr:hypothetical protein [sulfur-oxidizing endosymbiont of Gigantopelta aegis]
MASTQYAMDKITCIPTEKNWIEIIAKDAKGNGYPKISELIQKRQKQLISH